MYNLNNIKSLLDELEEDLNKFYNKGNKAASIRARKKLQKIKILSQDIRSDISETRNGLKK